MITSGPSNGSLVVNGDGTVTYTHDGSETVGDAFSYTIRDASGATSNVAAVSLTVSPQNDAPQINDQALAVDENAPAGTLVGTVVASDPDPGDSLAYAIVSGNVGGAFAIDPSNGDIFVANPGSLDFETNPSIVLVVEVEDLDGVRSTATVTVAVRNLNEPLELSGPVGLRLRAGESLVLSSAGGTAISVSDPDTADPMLDVTLSVNGGSATLASRAGLLMLSGSGTNDSSMSFRGAWADVGAALDGLVFNAGASVGMATLDLAVADADPAGGAAAISVGIEVQPAPVVEADVPDTAAADPEPDVPVEDLTEAERKAPEPEDDGTEASAPVAPATSPPAAPASPAAIAAEGFVGFVRSDGAPDVTALETRVAAISTDPLVAERTVAPETGGDEVERERVARVVVDFLRMAITQPELFDSLDQMRRDVLESAQDEAAASDWVVPAVESISLAATTGLLAGVLRSSSLLAMAVSSVPLWKRADPLMVLSLSGEERRDLEASLRAAGSGEQDLEAIFEGRTVRQQAARDADGANDPS